MLNLKKGIKKQDDVMNLTMNTTQTNLELAKLKELKHKTIKIFVQVQEKHLR